ncbi:MAG: RsiV family protein [Planctomycetota bacterium]
MKRTICWAALAACCMGQALADPTLVTREDGGHDAAHLLEYEVRWLEVRGLEPALASAINGPLEALGFDPLEGMRASLAGEGAEFSDPDRPNGLWVTQSPGLFNGRLLAVEVSESSYWSGAAHPNTAISAVVFDLTTGARLAPRQLFAAGDGVLQQVADKVNAALRAEYTLDGDYLLEAATPENLGAVLPTAEGVAFVWSSYGLGAPYAMGPPTVVLPYAELAGLLDGELFAKAQRKTVSLSLGEPEAHPEAIDPIRAYVDVLHEDALAAFSGLSVEERRALGAHPGAWQWLSGPDQQIRALEELGLPNLADGARDVLGSARRLDPLFQAIDFASSQVRMSEASVLEAALLGALERHETGRVVTLGNPLLVRGEDPEGHGQAFARLPHGAVVGVIERAQGYDLFHTVRLGDGRIGYVHKSYLLLEAPATVEGRVYRQPDGSYRFGPDRVLLQAKAGPGHPDAELDALRALTGPAGESPRVRLVAIQRERAFLEPWLAVVSFERAPEEAPADGIEDAVRR